MKIVSWNLKNIAQSKLTKNFGAKFRSFGLGNGVLQYMTQFIVGNGCWNNLLNTPGLAAPTDLFVIIELKTPGKVRNTNAAIQVPTQIINALNNYVAVNAIPNCHYNFVTPMITGRHEAVGMIYNAVTLNPIISPPPAPPGPGSPAALRNINSGQWFTPKTPYMARFQIIANPAAFINMIGIHAATPSGGQLVRFRPPIQYCRQLQTVLPAAPAANNFYFFGGDFNCNPADFYTMQDGTQVFPFALLPAGFGTHLPNNTLSSLKRKVNNALAPPANYLSSAYDNIIFNAPIAAANAREIVADLIGAARNMNAFGIPNVSVTNTVAVLSAYHQVSDHMPVILQW